MTLRRLLIALLAWLPTQAYAADEPRFSTGKIHSGIVEFELDLNGVKKLSVSVEGDSAAVEWIERTLIHSSGSRTPLEKIDRKKGGNYGLAGLDFVTFEAKARIVHEDDTSSQIHVFHDAPRPIDPKKIGKLTGDPRRGQGVFRRGTCTSCHALDGHGAKIGPDLATIGKESTIERLVESVIAPDAALAKGFETNIITTKDGTPHLGFVVEDKKKSISIKDSGGQIHKIDKAKVVSRKPQSFSLMPPFGELLTPQQIADLAAFLKTVQR